MLVQTDYFTLEVIGEAWLAIVKKVRIPVSPFQIWHVPYRWLQGMRIESYQPATRDAHAWPNDRQVCWLSFNDQQRQRLIAPDDVTRDNAISCDSYVESAHSRLIRRKQNCCANCVRMQANGVVAATPLAPFPQKSRYIDIINPVAGMIGAACF